MPTVLEKNSLKTNLFCVHNLRAKWYNISNGDEQPEKEHQASRMNAFLEFPNCYKYRQHLQ